MIMSLGHYVPTLEFFLLEYRKELRIFFEKSYFLIENFNKKIKKINQAGTVFDRWVPDSESFSIKNYLLRLGLERY